MCVCMCECVCMYVFNYLKDFLIVCVCVLCSGGGRLYFFRLLFLASVRACSRRCGRPGVYRAVQAHSA